MYVTLLFKFVVINNLIYLKIYGLLKGIEK
ncbi:hypothetical protein VcPa08_01461 [Vibrio cholerae]|nr:hypothetical protein VcPa01_01569 [Vibrio cholerae]GFK37212.1 hypothetical protein VcPa02_01784 [Vibrio cholerae]GFK40496.1 hypothetical protein VcPa03_01568 [Vibrio cholerae]GFK44216.1 hypothetical protein VcPa04_01738 [Vibrio cholerae]GFK48691.1 hypothetical protein VcPa05_02693 [Vibrio cholerae]